MLQGIIQHFQHLIGQRKVNLKMRVKLNGNVARSVRYLRNLFQGKFPGTANGRGIPAAYDAWTRTSITRPLCADIYIQCSAF